MVFEPDPKVKKTCALQNVTYIATTFISVVYIYRGSYKVSKRKNDLQWILYIYR